MLEFVRGLLILIACLALPFAWGWFAAQLFRWLGGDRFLPRAEHLPPAGPSGPADAAAADAAAEDLGDSQT